SVACGGTSDWMISISRGRLMSGPLNRGGADGAVRAHDAIRSQHSPNRIGRVVGKARAVYLITIRKSSFPKNECPRSPPRRVCDALPAAGLPAPDFAGRTVFAGDTVVVWDAVRTTGAGSSGGPGSAAGGGSGSAGASVTEASGRTRSAATLTGGAGAISFHASARVAPASSPSAAIGTIHGTQTAAFARRRAACTGASICGPEGTSAFVTSGLGSISVDNCSTIGHAIESTTCSSRPAARA